MNIPCDKNLEDEIKYYFKGWSTEHKRLMIGFDHRTEEEKKTFYSNFQGSHSNYTI